MVGMAGKKLDLGATGETVAANVTRLRDAAGLNYTEMSERLADAGRVISPVAVRRIESGERRVDTDDLVALALALGVSPITLLIPGNVDACDLVDITGISYPYTAECVWDWLVAERPIVAGATETTGDQWVEFVHRSWPRWKLQGLYENAYNDAVQRRPQAGFNGDDQ